MPTFNQNKINRLKIIDKLIKPFFLFNEQKKNKNKTKEEVENILIIVFLLIGDTIMYLPALKVLRKNFPNARITLIGGKAVKIILQYQNVFDEFIIVDCPWVAPFNKSIKNLLRFIRAIIVANKKAKYDLVIDFRGDWRNIFYMNFIKSTCKVSFNYTGGEYMLTHAFIPDNSIKHFGEESFYFLRLLGCSFKIEDKIPQLLLSDHVKEVQLGIKQIIPNDKIIVGIHPGTTQKIKQWDKEKYSDLITQLSVANSSLYFLIFEGPGEFETVNFITERIKSLNISYCTIKRNLEEYIASIGICDLMICNDSGAAHIASAYNIPTAIIFANVNPVYVTPRSFAPVKVISLSLECKPCFNSICKYGTNECIKSITVSEVYNAVQDILLSIKNRKEINVV